MFTGNHTLFCTGFGRLAILVLWLGFTANSASAGSAEIKTIGFAALTQGYWQIWTSALRQQTPKQLTHSAWDKKEPDWFSHGQSLIYRTANARLHILKIADAKDDLILGKYGDLFDPELSPDNASIVFTRFRADSPDNSDIWVYRFDEQRARRITNAAGLQYDPAWSPDGKKIVYVSSVKKGGQHAIWINDLNGGKPVCAAQKAFYNVMPDWSPDGKKIVFAADSADNYDIWLVTLGAENFTRLTDDSALDTQPVWSPDGSQLLFISNRNGAMQVWRMQADGSDQQPVTPSDLKCADPVWIGG